MPPKKPVRSPIRVPRQQGVNLGGLNEVVRLVQQLNLVKKNLEGALNKAVSELERLEKVQRGPQGLKGEKGERGDPFYKPIKGVDYFVKEDIEMMVSHVLNKIPKPKDGETPIRGVDYFTDEDIKYIASEVLELIPTPEDGKDAEELDPNDVVNLIKDKKLISIDDIVGLRENIRVLASQIGESKGGRYLSGAGVPSLSAGSNVTLTPKSDGGFTVNATSAGFAKEVPTGAINGSNTTYTVANEPLFVLIDGLMRTDGYGYTYTTGTIEVDALTPPVQSIVSFYNA